MSALLRRAAALAADSVAVVLSSGPASPWRPRSPHSLARSWARTYCAPATHEDKQGAPALTVSDAKQHFTHKVAQITRGDPSCAMSVLPTIVDVIMDSIPKAIHAVAITGISEEALQKAAAQEPFADNAEGCLPPMDLVFSVDPAQIFPVVRFLHSHAQLQFQVLTDMTAIDYPERTKARFEVTYVLTSVTANVRIMVKTMVDELTPLESVTPMFKNADWLERECWDMFGVYFKNHPDLRRLLTDYGFAYHPLRKDFPVQGYTEVFYSESRKGIATRPVQLAQTQRVVTDS